MVFKIGNNANPNGRPRKKPDPRSLMLEEMCKKHTDNIEKIVDVLIKKAMNGEDKAIKLVTDMFIPKAGTYAPVEKNTTHNKLNVQISPLVKDLSLEDQSALWQLLMRAKNKQPPMINVTNDEMK